MTSTATDPDARVIPEWELSDRLARSLRLVKLSVAEIADIMGVHRDTVSRWTNGRNKPAKAVLIVWSDITGCDLNWLENGEAPVEPTGATKRARRDSNPKPSVLERGHLTLVSSVRETRTPNLRPVMVRPSAYLEAS